MGQFVDMDQSEPNSAMASSFSNVTFCDIQELYTIDSAVNVQFVVSSPLRPSSDDSIGLYRIGWISVQNHIGLVQVPLVNEESSAGENSSTTLNVTFNGNNHFHILYFECCIKW